MKGFAAILAVGLVVATLLAVDRVSFAATGPATVRITAEQERLTRVDVGVKGRSPGDTEIVWQELFNKHVTDKAIGHAEFVCTFTAGRTRLCSGTYFLPKGKLMVQGVLRYRQFYELGIVGGTGLYDNARGAMTVTRLSDEPNRSLALFTLVG
jgi:hypothetical protein